MQLVAPTCLEALRLGWLQQEVQLVSPKQLQGVRRQAWPSQPAMELAEEAKLVKQVRRPSHLWAKEVQLADSALLALPLL